MQSSRLADGEPCDARRVAFLELFTIIVADYDPAIAFYTGVLGFELIDDSPATTTHGGRPKRWVVVRPRGGQTGILLARADGGLQEATIGKQMGGRVGYFLRVDDFEAERARMTAAGVRFLGEPRVEPYGSVVVFEDLCGNRWDLLGPDPRTA
jgi:catechol 2,3-dioxygenase-like lactoylglutathione lyase family enzyme